MNGLSISEKIEEIVNELGIDISDWYGKYLLLAEILKSMDSEDANTFLSDTFDVLEKEIKEME